jgi:hypothetical protein
MKPDSKVAELDREIAELAARHAELEEKKWGCQRHRKNARP